MMSRRDVIAMMSTRARRLVLWGVVAGGVVAMASGCLRFGPASEDRGPGPGVEDAGLDGDLLDGDLLDGDLLDGDVGIDDAAPRDSATGELDGDGGEIGATHAWSRRWGGSLADRGVAVAVDADGNIILAGLTASAIDLGGGLLPNKGSYDIFLASFSKTGAYRWAKTFGGAGWDRVGGLAVDGQGNSYLVGYFPGTIDFGSGPMTSTAQMRIFFVSFSSTGKLRWAKSFGGDRYAEGLGITVDGAGYVTITGIFQQTINFGGANLQSASYSHFDAFLASFTSLGVHRWSKRFGESAGHDYGLRVVATGSGDVTMAGLFQHSVDFGGGALVSAGGNDIVLASYTQDGGHRWSKRFGGAASERLSALAVDAKGRVYLAGDLRDPLSFGGSVLKSAGSDDIYLASFTSLGAHRWSRRFGGSAGEYVTALTLDSAGALVMTGRFGSTLDVGGGISSLRSVGADDIYLASFTAAGQARWALRLGGASWDRSLAVASGPGGAIVVTGSFEKSADFGGGIMTSAGLQDIFLTRWID